MDLTHIDRSSIMPHLRALIDDLITITKDIVLKREDIADNYETTNAMLLSQYYSAIIAGEDSLDMYESYPIGGCRNVLEWMTASSQFNYYFFDRNNMPHEPGTYTSPRSTVLTITDDPDFEPDDDTGELGDGYIVMNSKYNKDNFIDISNSLANKVTDKQKVYRTTKLSDEYYYCNCKNLIGKSHNGEICPNCGTEVVVHPKVITYDVSHIVELPQLDINDNRLRFTTTQIGVDSDGNPIIEDATYYMDQDGEYTSIDNLERYSKYETIYIIDDGNVYLRDYKWDLYTDEALRLSIKEAYETEENKRTDEQNELIRNTLFSIGEPDSDSFHIGSVVYEILDSALYKKSLSLIPVTDSNLVNEIKYRYDNKIYTDYLIYGYDEFISMSIKDDDEYFQNIAISTIDDDPIYETYEKVGNSKYIKTNDNKYWLCLSEPISEVSKINVVTVETLDDIGNMYGERIIYHVTGNDDSDDEPGYYVIENGRPMILDVVYHSGIVYSEQYDQEIIESGEYSIHIFTQSTTLSLYKYNTNRWQSTNNEMPDTSEYSDTVIYMDPTESEYWKYNSNHGWYMYDKEKSNHDTAYRFKTNSDRILYTPITSYRDKYYYVEEDNTVWKYINGEWTDMTRTTSKINIGLYLFRPNYHRYIKWYAFSDSMIEEMNLTKTCPDGYEDRLLKGLRKWVIDTYLEPESSPSEEFKVPRYMGEQNRYYRMLNGLPAIDRMTSQPKIDRTLQLSPSYSGPNKIIPLYSLTDKEADYARKIGLIDKWLDMYNGVSYLNYMGSNRIDTLAARNANNYDILRMGTAKNKYHQNMFITNFQLAKDYILARHNNPELFTTQQYYRSYVGMLIVLQTILMCISKNDTILINHHYTDEETVRLRLESYGLNVFDDIPLIYRKNIAKYIERLILNKGIDSLYQIVIDIFGIDNIEVCKYFYRKTTDDDGTPDLNMVQIPVDNKTFVQQLLDAANIRSYDEITKNDIYWGGYGMPVATKTGEPIGDADEYLKTIIENKTFNYMNSKYISLNTVYNLSRLNYYSSYLLNFLMELSARNIDITIKIDTIDGSYPLFHLMILLFAIQAKRLNIEGNIQYEASSVAYLMKYNLDGYVTLNNGEKISIVDLYKNTHKEQYYKYLIEKNTKNSISSIANSDIANDTNTLAEAYNHVVNNPDTSLVELDIPETITLDSICESYMNNSKNDAPYNNLLTLREQSDTIEDYMAWNDLFKALCLAKRNNSIFALRFPYWRKLKASVTIEASSSIYPNKDLTGEPIIFDEDTVIEFIGTYYIKSEAGYEQAYILNYNDNRYYVIADSVIGTTIVDELDKSGSYYVYEGESLSDITPDYSIDKIYAITKSMNDNDETIVNYYIYQKYALTYEEFIKQENPELYDLIEETSEDTIDGKLTDDYYDRIIGIYSAVLTSIESYIKDDDFKKLMASMTTDISAITDYIRKVIMVFKAFEVDIATINLLYTNKPEDFRIKFIEELSIQEESTYMDHFHMVNDLGIHENIMMDSGIKMIDELNIRYGVHYMKDIGSMDIKLEETCVGNKYGIDFRYGHVSNTYNEPVEVEIWGDINLDYIDPNGTIDGNIELIEFGDINYESDVIDAFGFVASDRFNICLYDSSVYPNGWHSIIRQLGKWLLIDEEEIPSDAVEYESTDFIPDNVYIAEEDIEKTVYCKCQGDRYYIYDKPILLEIDRS